MDIKGYCESCRKEFFAPLEEITKKLMIRGKELQVIVHEARCPICGEFLDNEKNDKENDILIFDAYKATQNLMTSTDLFEMRKRKGLTQTQLAEKLHLGAKDVARYENGAIQNASVDLLLKIEASDAGSQIIDFVDSGGNPDEYSFSSSLLSDITSEIMSSYVQTCFHHMQPKKIVYMSVGKQDVKVSVPSSLNKSESLGYKDPIVARGNRAKQCLNLLNGGRS
jgi:putative zinc finger/helix-turn-helix YgiT family protein